MEDKNLNQEKMEKMEEVRINYKEKTLLNPVTDLQKEVNFFVEDTDLQLQMKMLSAKKELQKIKVYLETVKTTYPFKLIEYLEVVDNIESLERDINRTKKVMKEFGFDIKDE